LTETAGPTKATRMQLKQVSTIRRNNGRYVREVNYSGDKDAEDKCQ